VQEENTNSAQAITAERLKANDRSGFISPPCSWCTLGRSEVHTNVVQFVSAWSYRVRVGIIVATWTLDQKRIQSRSEKQNTIDKGMY